MTLLFVFISFTILISSTASRADRLLQSQMYQLYSLYLIILCLIKPFGVGQDDANYVEIVKTGCTSFSCEDTFSIFRDFIWFYFVSFASDGYEFTVVKIVASISLSIKLYCIYKLAPNKLFALSVYVFVFYILHDLTQYRAGLSSCFFILAFYAISKHRQKSSFFYILSAIGSHIQAAAAVSIFALPRQLRSGSVVLIFGSAILILIYFDFAPSLNSITSIASYALGNQYDPSSDVGKYLYLADSGSYDFSKISIISIFVILSLLQLNVETKNSTPHLIDIAVVELSWSSIFAAYALYFVFSSVIDIQNRLFEFLIIPIVFLFGNSKLTLRSSLALYTLCISFFVKFHILSSIFI